MASNPAATAPSPLLIHGDCLQALSDLPNIDAVVTDPPYGIKHNTNYSRFSGGLVRAGPGHDYLPIANDNRPFDPSPWLRFPRVVLFGFNCFSDRLPRGTLLVWCKKRHALLGKLMSDCEVAWMNKGHGVYLFHHEWSGFMRESERGKTLHPTQKPIALMRWCIEKLRLKPGSTILDPYMGAGATGIAAIQLGHRFIGIEQHEPYFKIAERRILAAERAA